MTEPISTEFKCQLADLVMAVLHAGLSPDSVVTDLMAAVGAIVLGAGINIDDLMADLADINANQQQRHLH